VVDFSFFYLIGLCGFFFFFNAHCFCYFDSEV
jgi:hypothetical protein